MSRPTTRANTTPAETVLRSQKDLPVPSGRIRPPSRPERDQTKKPTSAEAEPIKTSPPAM